MNGEGTSERRGGMGTESVEQFGTGSGAESDIYGEPPVDSPWHTSGRWNEFVKCSSEMGGIKEVL